MYGKNIETLKKENMNLADKIYIFDQKLFIHTSIGPLKNELGFQKVQIIERVNEKMGENVISEVIIK